MPATARVIGAVGGLWLIAALAATPAAAVLETNDLGCAGSAIIVDEDGERHGINAEDRRVVLPRSGDAAWSASTSTLSKNHTGRVWIEIGPLEVELGKWDSPNDLNLQASADTKSYDVPDWVPPFLLTIRGQHDAAGDPTVGAPPGTCAGYVEVGLGGDVFDSPVGIGIVAATVIVSVLWLSAGVPRKG